MPMPCDSPETGRKADGAGENAKPHSDRNHRPRRGTEEERTKSAAQKRMGCSHPPLAQGEHLLAPRFIRPCRIRHFSTSFRRDSGCATAWFKLLSARVAELHQKVPAHDQRSCGEDDVTWKAH